MYFENLLQEIIENFIPGRTDIVKLAEVWKLASGIIKRLHIRQMLPPVKEPTDDVDENASDRESDSGKLKLKIIITPE